MPGSWQRQAPECVSPRSVNYPWTAPAAMPLQQFVSRRRTPRPRRIRLDRRRRIQQRLHDAPLLLDAVLPRKPQALTLHGGVEQHLVRCCPLAAFLAEFHVERDRLRPNAAGAACLEREPYSRRGIEFDHKLVWRARGWRQVKAE